MKIVVISGSTRAGSQSLKVAEYLAARLGALGVEATVMDLNEKRLPLYDDTGEGQWKEMWQGMSAELASSDGYVFVSPEWDGMFSVGIHNMLHYAEKEMSDKPVLAVGVSSGRGGRYPLVQMRIMGYKNKNIVVIPENLYFDHIEESLINGEFVDNRNAERADYALRVLTEYAKALVLVRASGVIDYKRFPNGL
jgi:NAD(P)H-dependent FMN reductase